MSSMSSDTGCLDGGCTCRHVRFRMTSRPLFVHCCHCRWCQRESGSAFALNAVIESERVTLLAGDVDRIDTPSASCNGQEVARCPRCRVALWSHYAGAGRRVSFVRVGTLGDPDRVAPDIHIDISSTQRWVVIPPGASATEAYCRASEKWPAESLARREALRAGEASGTRS